VPYPADATQTAVELTFSFAIASMQLTPTFRIGTMQLRPISDVVTMRLSPSEHSQSGWNFQTTFEIAEIEPIVGGFGTMRLTPSHRDRPSSTGPPSFAVAGLQVGSNGEPAPIQVMPAQEASALVTGRFQIASIEFSPFFDLACIVFNSSGRDVTVQFPGVQSVEEVVRFEVIHLQLGSSGEIGMLQLNLLEQPPTRTPQVRDEARVENANEMEPLEDAVFSDRKADPVMRAPVVRLRPAH
jgi:hypothetical protein